MANNFAKKAMLIPWTLYLRRSYVVLGLVPKKSPVDEELGLTDELRSALEEALDDLDLNSSTRFIAASGDRCFTETEELLVRRQG